MAPRCCSPPESSAGRWRLRAAEADVFEGGLDAGGALVAIDFGEAQRELDIFREGHAGEEIERLEDHADGVAAVAGEFDGIDGGEVAAADVDGAGGGTVESGQEIEEGGLAGAGAAEERDEFALADFEGDVVDGGDGGVAEMVVAGDVLGLDEGCRLSWSRFGVGLKLACGVPSIVVRVRGGGIFPGLGIGFRLGFAFGGIPPMFLEECASCVECWGCGAQEMSVWK